MKGSEGFCKLWWMKRSLRPYEHFTVRRWVEGTDARTGSYTFAAICYDKKGRRWYAGVCTANNTPRVLAYKNSSPTKPPLRSVTEAGGQLAGESICDPAWLELQD